MTSTQGSDCARNFRPRSIAFHVVGPEQREIHTPDQGLNLGSHDYESTTLSHEPQRRLQREGTFLVYKRWNRALHTQLLHSSTFYKQIAFYTACIRNQAIDRLSMSRAKRAPRRVAISRSLFTLRFLISTARRVALQSAVHASRLGNAQ